MPYIALLFLLLFGSFAHAQTNPGWVHGFVPTAAQWNAQWSAKQDYNGSITGSSVTAGSPAQTRTMGTWMGYLTGVQLPGNFSIAGTLAVGGATSLASTLNVTGTSTLTGAVTGYSFEVPLTGFASISGDTLPHTTRFRRTYTGWVRNIGCYNCIGSSNDTLQMIRGAGGSIAVIEANLSLQSGYNGGRVGFDAFILEPDTAVTTQIRATRGHIGLKGAVVSNNNVGGISTGFGTSFFGWGLTYGANFQALVGPGGTYRRALTGIEVDVAGQTGASYNVGYGVLVALTQNHAVQAYNDWAGFQLGSSAIATTAGGWKTGLAGGSNSSNFPFHTNSTFIQGNTGVRYTSMPPTLRGGFDVRQMNFTDNVVKWDGGQITNGSNGGSIQIGFARLYSTVTGTYLNADVQKTDSVVIATPGTGYSANDIVKTAKDTYVRVDGRITKEITAATTANPVRITSVAHGLSNGTIFDVSTDDPESETACVSTVTGMGELEKQNIIGFTLANPGVMTVANHGLANDTWVRISAVGGATQLNGNPYYIIANVTQNTFTLKYPNGTAVDSTNWNAYTSGGCIRITYIVQNAAADEFDLYTQQGNAVNGTNWSAYGSGARIQTYIPDRISVHKSGWLADTTGETTGVATESILRQGRQYGSGLTIDQTWHGMTPLWLQNNGNVTYAGGILASAGTTAGLALQTRANIQARTAMVASITIEDGGEYASAPTLVFSAPSGSGTTATATVATLGAKNATSFAGGTLYKTNQILTLVGGTSTQTAQFVVSEVDDVTTGVPTRLTLHRAGSYTVLPASPVSVTGGTGSGLTITPSWEILTTTLTGAGTNYPEFPPPTLTSSGGGKISDAAFTIAMTGSDGPLTIQPTGGATVVGGTELVPRMISGTSAPTVQLWNQVTDTSDSLTFGMVTDVTAFGTGPFEHWGFLSKTELSDAGVQGRMVAGYFQGNSVATGAATYGQRQSLGIVSEVRDGSGDASSVSNLIIQAGEFDVAADGDDDLAPYGRAGVVIITKRIGGTGTMTASYGLSINSQPNSQWKRGIRMAGQYTVSGFDTTDATFVGSAPAIRLAAGNIFALDASAVTSITSDATAITLTGHWDTAGTAPAVSSCGTSPSAVTGNDTAGTLTTGTAGPTACTLTFATAFAVAPKCLANASVGGVPQAVAPTAISTTAVTFTFAAAMTSGTVDYHCIQ